MQFDFSLGRFNVIEIKMTCTTNIILNILRQQPILNYMNLNVSFEWQTDYADYK